MKKLLFSLLILSTLCARPATMQWTLQDHVAGALTVRKIYQEPIYYVGVFGTNFVTGDRRTITNGTPGVLWNTNTLTIIVTNLYAGALRTIIPGPYKETILTNTVPDTNGFVLATDYTGVATNLPQYSFAYSQAVSDSRYIRTNLIKNYIYPGSNVTFVTNANGTVTVSSTGGGSGSATNVYFLDSPSITWSTTSSSNVAALASAVSNDWKNYTLAASNSITANTTNFVVGTSNSIAAGVISGSINAATATSASNVVAGITNLILNQRNGLLPPQVPSSLFNDWNSGILLLTNGTIALEDTHLSEASIGSIGDKLGLFYSSYDAGSTGRIFAAYGTLLNGFTKHGVVLAPTVASWDSGLIGGATHYREGRTNYLYYFGGTNFGAFEAEPTHIGVAYSTDGTNFTKYASNPIMQTTDITEGNCVTLYTWFTKKVGLTYYGFFNAKHSSGTATEKVHLATAANPLGPWTYYGEIYRHTNASVTSDFTVADLPGGGYIAAYWVITNGFALSQSAYSDDLITWRHVARLNNTALVGTRLFYDDGIVLSYCVDQTSVYYTRPKRSYMGDFSAGIISASIVSGDGSGLTGVGANSLVDFQAATSGDDLSLIADIPGTVADPNYWTYNLSSLRWRTTGGIIAGSGFIGSAAGLSNAPSGLFPGIIISTNTGSAINAVGITNGNVTIPGTLGVTGATTAGVVTVGSIGGSASGLSNFSANAVSAAFTNANVIINGNLTLGSVASGQKFLYLHDGTDAGRISYGAGSFDFDYGIQAAQFSGGGINLTTLNASSLSSGTVPIERLIFDSYTNGWSMNTPFVLGRTNAMISSGAATGGITGVANLPTEGARFGELTFIATGTITFTNPASMRANDYLTSRTLTNGNVVEIALKVILGVTTNLSIVQFK